MAFTFPTRVSHKWIPWVLVDVLLFLIFALLAWHYYPSQQQASFQLDLARKMLHGQAPYVNFTSEYPPLALFSFLLPALLFRTVTAYFIAFTIELLLFDLLAMFLIVRISSQLGISASRSLLIHAFIITAIGPIIVASFDIIPAVLVLLALTFLVSGRTNAAWAVLGLAVMTKLYPVIAVPFFILYQMRQKQYKEVVKGAVIFIALVMAISLPWLALNARGYLASFTYHLERGLHSESTYGSILLLGKIWGLVQVEGVYNFSSWNLYSPLADQLARVSFIIMAGLLCIVYFLYGRAIFKSENNAVERVSHKPVATATLLQYVTAAIFVFILSGKVFSMQYLVWLCPLLPLITGRRQVLINVLFLAAGFLSQAMYPYSYGQFEHYVPLVIVMMFARNFLLIVCAVFILLPGERKLKKRLNDFKSYGY